MPANKRQHYVPQNYLKEFSPDGDSIGVYHIASDKWADTAGIKYQAQQPYFYGTGLELEKDLSELERKLAENRKSIIENGTQHLSLYQRETLYQDMMLQFLRTKQMADLYEQSATAKARRLWKLSKNELVCKYADCFVVKYPIPALGPMMALLNNIEICLDLGFKILVNLTDIPFITSDAPVCKYNKYFEALNKPVCGLKHQGLMLFYPLSSKYAVLYFDQAVYKAPYKRRIYLDIDDVSDVNNLNGLLCSWANECIYYNPSLVPGEHIQWTFKHIEDARRPLFIEKEIKQSDTKSLIIAQYPFPFLYMDLSFLKFQDKIKLIYE